MDQAAFADTPASRCAFYRRTCGLPVGVDPHSGRITLASGLVWAITMPTDLGQAIKVHMQRRQYALGPIISHPRSHRWTYLIRPDLPDDVRLFAELFRLDVAVVRAGAGIALPSPSDRDGQFRVWVEAPRDHYRPSGAIVVESIRACADAR